MIRSVWFLITVVALTVWFGGRSILASWRGVRYEPGGLYDRMTRGWGRGLMRLNGVKASASGAEKFEANRPYVFASNHVSLVDIWVLVATIPNSFRFVAKQELLRVPIFGRALRSAGHIYIDRRKMKSAFGAYEEAATAIRGGLSAVVFVEGTRGQEGQLLPFKKGPFVLAIQAGVPVVPVFITGSGAILPTGKMRIRPGIVRVRFGVPISTTGLRDDDREALSDRTRSAMEALAGVVDDQTATD